MPQKLPNLIKSTAGAVPVYNDKGVYDGMSASYMSDISMYNTRLIQVNLLPVGELTMQKVKVTRYVSGRRPEYALSDSESESSDDEGLVPVTGEGEGGEAGEPGEDVGVVDEEVIVQDRRLLRLRERQSASVRGSRYE